MAQQRLIELLSSCGISATVEYEGGTWGHSREYTRLRSAGKEGLKKMLKSDFLTGNTRAGIQLALLNNRYNSEVVEEIEQ